VDIAALIRATGYSIIAPQADCIVKFVATLAYIASMSPAVKSILEMMASGRSRTRRSFPNWRARSRPGAPAFIA
jgi:hypothetical protein